MKPIVFAVVALAITLGLYVLSIGPAHCLWRHGYLADDTFGFCYRPHIRAQNGNTTLKNATNSYILWCISVETWVQTYRPPQFSDLEPPEPPGPTP